MKLSEVIKAIEDGSKTKYKSDEFLIYERGGDISFEFEEKPIIFIDPGRQFEEVKPPRQWNEKELILFKLLPDWAKWIMRCGNYTHGYENEPDLHGYTEFGKTIYLSKFEFLKLEDSEKIYIGDLKGE